MRLSIVVPVLNEADSLPLLEEQVRSALANAGITWELIFVDDGSTDGSVECLRKLAMGSPARVCVVVLRRNFGQTAAMAAGAERATGDLIAFMDADLQNDPADLPDLLSEIDAGADLVCGWRQHRQDGFLCRRLPSLLANRLLGWVTGVRVRDYGCTLKIFRRELLDALPQYGDMHRYLPAYAACIGAVIRECPVRHHPRCFGRSKYGLNRTGRVLLDLLLLLLRVRFAARPLQLFGRIAMPVMLSGIALLLAALFRRPAVLLPMGAILLSAGMQMLLFGLLAELQIQGDHAARHVRAYHVREVIESTPEEDGIMSGERA